MGLKKNKVICRPVNEDVMVFKLHVTISTKSPLLYLVCLFVCFSLHHVHDSGAGQEVGRSCIIVEFKGRKIMVGLLSHGRSSL